ncbi:MAG: methyl-accepting chemotaxis protein [Oceanospirillaceae bacterium]|nr:methyl-accepting chemotaxis protein [Oceanospirillaceae bacterium]MCP5350180.1 methyl-accepting chemotaxis protein [Oceanospirillaceae bacterium]
MRRAAIKANYTSAGDYFWQGQPMGTLQRLRTSFISLGLLMGLCFPLYAQFFVNWKEGMFVWFMLGCLIAGASIGVFNYVLVQRILISQLLAIAEVSSAIAQKDLRARCDASSKDVVGDIMRNVNQMADGLDTAFGEIRSIVDATSGAITDMHKTTSSNSRALSQQSQVSQRTLAALDALNQSAQSILRDTEQAAEAADRADGHSNTGTQFMLRSVDAMRLLTYEVSQAAAAMDELKEQSQQIGNVLDVIRGISEQTNLLALNAAIEAARAGEQGRGFAVVADEVRALASRTRDATGDIQKMIELLQSRAINAATVMLNGHTQTQDSLKLIEETQHALATIGNEVRAINQTNHTISTATSHQNRAIDEVSQNLHQLLDIARQANEFSEGSDRMCVSVGGRIEQLKNIVHAYRL